MSKRSLDETAVEIFSPSVVVASGHLILSLVMSIVRGPYEAVPKEYWGLNRAIDLMAPRGFRIGSDESFEVYCRYYQRVCPYPMVSLTTHREFNTPFTVVAGVKTVVFYSDFDSPVIFSAGLERLSLSSKFNQPLHNLPGSLRELQLGFWYNSPLTLPSQLRRLDFPFAHAFNHPITLPPNIQHVVLGPSFDWALVLPPSLRTMQFGLAFDQPILFPEGIEEINFTIYDQFFQHPLTSLPSSLKKLTLSKTYNRPVTLLAGLIDLHLGKAFDQPITLPSTLKSLQLDCLELRHPLYLPEGLETLRVTNDPFTHPTVMPDSLHSLNVGGVWTQPLVFPPYLRELTWKCNHPLPVLPTSLRELGLGEKFNLEVDLSYHMGLVTLLFDNFHYNMPVVVPPTLTSLIFQDDYNLPLELPPGCVRERMMDYM